MATSRLLEINLVCCGCEMNKTKKPSVDGFVDANLFAR